MKKTPTKSSTKPITVKVALDLEEVAELIDFHRRTGDSLFFGVTRDNHFARAHELGKKREQAKRK
jgi:hypothetical protein